MRIENIRNAERYEDMGLSMLKLINFVVTCNEIFHVRGAAGTRVSQPHDLNRGWTHRKDLVPANFKME